MRLTEDTILQREVVSRTAQKRAPITAHGSSGCYVMENEGIDDKDIEIYLYQMNCHKITGAS
jgi:hypothetical protein